MSREVYTHRFFTDALFPHGGNDRRRESKQEAMVFKDAARHDKKNQDSIFLEVRSLFQRPCFLGPGLCRCHPLYSDRCCLCTWLFMKSL